MNYCMTLERVEWNMFWLIVPESPGLSRGLLTLGSDRGDFNLMVDVH